MAKMTGNVRGERLINENGYKPWLWKRNNQIRMKMSVRNGIDYERTDFRRYIRDLC